MDKIYFPFTRSTNELSSNVVLFLSHFRFSEVIFSYLSGTNYTEAMDTSKKCRGAGDTGTHLPLKWIRRVSAIPNLLVLTSISVNMLAVTTLCSCEETRVLHGMTDTAAVIGKLFYYPISPHAFQGKTSLFQVNT